MLVTTIAVAAVLTLGVLVYSSLAEPEDPTARVNARDRACRR